MNADIKGSLNQLNKCWHLFEHNGKPMSKRKVKAVLEYGLNKGLKAVSDLSNEEIDRIIESID